MRSTFLASLLTVVFLLLPISVQAAPAAKQYGQARSAYMKLKKADPKVGKLDEWETAAEKLQRFVEDHPKAKQVPSAIFLLGRLYETTYFARKSRSGLSRSVHFFERLARDYQGSSLADDALLRLGDLRRKGLNDEVAARAAYYEILDAYPKGDQVRVARARLGLNKKNRGKKVAKKPAKSPLRAEKKRKEAATRSRGLSLFGGSNKSREVYTKKPAGERPLIVIDPGHGGEEDGAIGVEGKKEKEIVLDISLLLDELLRERLRARTVLTRVRDIDIPLQERTKIANESGADVFISVHANASEYRTAKGVETYYLDNTNDKSSLKLAKRENLSAIKHGSDLSFIISDLIQSGKLEDSVSLAHYIQDNLHRTLARYYKGVKNLGVKKAPFFVLVGAHMPCVLVEVSFMDHPVEGRRLLKRRYRKLIATGIYQGIREFFERQEKS